METVSNRLYELMAKFGVNQSDIVKRTKIPKSSLSMYLAGTRIPKQDKISLIARAYNISETWLMGYDVPMRKSTNDDPMAEIMYENFLTDIDVAIYKEYGYEMYIAFEMLRKDKANIERLLKYHELICGQQHEIKSEEDVIEELNNKLKNIYPIEENGDDTMLIKPNKKGVN